VTGRWLIACTFVGLALLTAGWAALAALGSRPSGHNSPLALLDLPPPAPPPPKPAPPPAPPRTHLPPRHPLMARAAFLTQQIDDNAAAAKAGLGSAAFTATLAGERHLKEGRLPEALASFDAACRASPDSPPALRGRAAALTRLNRIPEAIHDYETLIKFTPLSAVDHYNFAVCLCRAQRLSDAADHLHRAIELQPTFDRAVYNLAIVCQQQGKLADAIANWRRFCDRQPAVASAWFNIGVACHDLGKPDDALAAFQKAVELQPADPTSQLNLALALLQLKRPAEAEAPLTRAVDLNPKDEQALAELVDLHRHLATLDQDVLRHHNEGLRLARRLLDMNPNYPEIRQFVDAADAVARPAPPQ